MAIQISENQGIISVYGSLNRQNVEKLNQYVSHFFKPAQRVVVNLERVKAFDSGAAFALLKMFVNAVHSNSRLYIVGRNNERLLHSLIETKTLEIWNQANNLK